MNKFILPTIAFLSLTACEPQAAEDPVQPAAQDMFFQNLSLLCGKSYGGALVSDEAVDADMTGKPMVMHVTNCTQDQIEIPFHISEGSDQWNRSRTWIITRNNGESGPSLRLKHRHRHEDGSLDAVTNYGGDTATPGTAERQEFPVDAESIASFKANGLDQSVTNVWAMEITPPGQSDAKFAYELKRTNEPAQRFFRVEFDLSKPVATPPPAWGEKAGQAQ